ncbi:uncharacterized protein L3040_000175 [Drepanopeziza brunnea f. sp. 'multigermtubi']|uniref:Uncharacterized protein n=1 Tax=Marssonina brunnea f. sp. multigermtubi (strain MB_m1) TaxID=1072389 RepID=K1WQQ9_MARBU|nr:uncharacterized protein MBM_07373 [Drepanopeziza brunnea f. sp. 'multigermtubi' MB_m1]EKD14652.1 hypothetical protein MBM_07373 [Drepanopeziza brunnea f. sp. 'multigermtubi' MB_m1]KAJ5053885.1 hypothetical protein L3040_000175 [Drepanopeziza brunnea f. sp. 'multigermtubi']
MLRSKSLFAISLALSSLFSRAHAAIVIGYATLTEEEGQRLSENKGLEIDEDENYNQLGAGLYTMNNPGNLMGGEGMWYCAIEANEEKLRGISKVYVPRSYERTRSFHRGPEKVDLWGAEDDVIVDFIEETYLVQDPAKALRFSWNHASPWHLLMVVPIEAANDDSLDIQARCFKSKVGLIEATNESINWEHWGIKGTRGAPGFAPLP